MPKVLISDKLSETAVAILKDRGLDAVSYTHLTLPTT